MDPTINGPLFKCVRCQIFSPRPKLPAGLFRAFLQDYCEPCQKAVEREWKEQEAQRISEEKARASAERAARQKASRIEALGGDEPFENFLFEKYKPELNNTHDWFAHVKNFPLEARNLFVYGPPGTGKTFLCTSVVRSMWEKGGTCRVLTAQQAVNRILFKDFGRSRNGFEQEEAVKELAAVDGLFIDELNELDTKERYITALKQLVDMRARRRKRGLLVAANVDLKTVATLMGLPIADRMRDQTFDVFRIPDDTPSARGILKQHMKQGNSRMKVERT